MLSRNIEGPTMLLESVRFLSEHGAYRDALVTASVWAPRFAGQFDVEQQAELNTLLERAQQQANIPLEWSRSLGHVELDHTDLQQLEAALDELRQLHDDESYGMQLGSERINGCLCSAAAHWRAARAVTDNLRGQLGLRPRLL